MLIVLPGEFTDQNTFFNAERGSRYAGANIKKSETDRVEMEMWAQGLKDQTVNPKARSKVVFTWYTKDSRKDPDNIAFAKKFILDGLVKSGILWADTLKAIGKFEDNFEEDPENPRVEVEITPMPVVVVDK